MKSHQTKYSVTCTISTADTHTQNMYILSSTDQLEIMNVESMEIKNISGKIDFTHGFTRTHAYIIFIYR